MNNELAGPNPIRFLALGDSYTIGESVPTGESWPRLLGARLSLEPTVLATTGWTSGELLEAYDREEPAGSFGLVSLQIGVNDQYRGLPVDEFVANTTALLDRARGACDSGGEVFGVSIPDWGVTPFAEGRDRGAIAVEIDRFNLAFGELLRDAGVPLVDVTAISRSLPEEVAPDGLHPSAEQYRDWVDVIAPVAGAVLGRRSG